MGRESKPGNPKMRRAKSIASKVEYGENSYGAHEACGADRTDAAHMLRVGIMAAAIFARLKL